MNLKMTMISGGNLSRQLEDFMQKSLKRENYRDSILDTMDQQKNEIFKAEGSVLQINPRRSPLSVSTAKARANRTGYYKKSSSNPGILRWTGNLQDNLSRIKSAFSCAMIFNAKYAIYHQDGKGRKHRSVFEFNPKIKAEIMRTIQTQFNNDIGVWNARKAS